MPFVVGPSGLPDPRSSLGPARLSADQVRLAEARWDRLSALPDDTRYAYALGWATFKHDVIVPVRRVRLEARLPLLTRAAAWDPNVDVRAACWSILATQPAEGIRATAFDRVLGNGPRNADSNERKLAAAALARLVGTDPRGIAAELERLAGRVPRTPANGEILAVVHLLRQWVSAGPEAVRHVAATSLEALAQGPDQYFHARKLFLAAAQVYLGNRSRLGHQLIRSLERRQVPVYVQMHEANNWNGEAARIQFAVEPFHLLVHGTQGLRIDTHYRHLLLPLLNGVAMAFHARQAFQATADADRDPDPFEHAEGAFLDAHCLAMARNQAAESQVGADLGLRLPADAVEDHEPGFKLMADAFETGGRSALQKAAATLFRMDAVQMESGESFLQEGRNRWRMAENVRVIEREARLEFGGEAALPHRP